MEEELKYLNNEIQQVYVRGIDTIHIANALRVISDLIEEMSKNECVHESIANKSDKNDMSDSNSDNR